MYQFASPFVPDTLILQLGAVVSTFIVSELHVVVLPAASFTIPCQVISLVFDCVPESVAPQVTFELELSP